MEGIALSTNDLVEILSTYAASAQAISSVAASPGWFVVGAFHMPTSFDVRLVGIASVSDPTLVLRARLFDLTSTPPAPLGAVLSTSSVLDEGSTSAAMSLIGGHEYQMQVEVVGPVGYDKFGALKSLGLVAA